MQGDIDKTASCHTAYRTKMPHTIIYLLLLTARSCSIETIASSILSSPFFDYRPAMKRFTMTSGSENNGSRTFDCSCQLSRFFGFLSLDGLSHWVMRLPPRPMMQRGRDRRMRNWRET